MAETETPTADREAHVAAAEGALLRRSGAVAGCWVAELTPAPR